MRTFVIAIEGEKEIKKEYSDTIKNSQVVDQVKGSFWFLKKPYAIYESFQSKMNEKGFEVGIDRNPPRHKELRAFRVVHHITAQEMTLKLNISVYTFYRFEDGTKKLTGVMSEKIEDAIWEILEERATIGQVKRAS